VKRAAAITLGLLLAIAAGSFALAAWSQATPPDPNVVVDKVEICHKPPSSKRQSVSVDSIKGSGHDSHDDDIIPPFRYDGGTYPGKNWDLEGQATWYYDCQPADVPDVTPTVDCVEVRPGGLVGHFGYNAGEAATIEVGLVNRFDPPPENRSQPSSFTQGSHSNVVQVPFTGSLAWVLAGRSVTASEGSRRCQASIRIDKSLAPSADPGRFDLLLDNAVLASGVGDKGSTNTQPVNAGQPHTVSERAAGTTSLDDYDSSIVCRDNGGSGVIVAEGQGTSLNVTPAPAAAIVCVIANKRKEEPPPDTHEIDLEIVKGSSPRSVLVGDRITWTVRVTNKGPAAATHVVIEDSLPDDVSYVGGSLVVSPGVTCIGARCTYASLPKGESIAGRFVTTATAVGQKTNTVTVDADEHDTNPANNAASAQVLVTGRDDEVVTPILECVDAHSDGTYRAHFGYLNEGNAAVTIPVGVKNSFSPAPEDRGQPTHFQPERAADVFQVDFVGTIVWTLTGRTSTASSSSKRCAAASGTLRVDKVLRPASDPGRFNLEIDGVPAGSGRGVGDFGTTGDVSVTPGQHRVGEEGAKGTSLANYETTIACRGNRGRGAVNSAFAGPELVVDVPAGAEVVCTITNTRRSGPPVPPPQPPPAPTPPPPPAPGTADLLVQKFVDRRIGRLDGIVTWTVVVTNNGPVAATGVTITDKAAAGATFVSLQISQGTCGKTTCALGTIAPGASVRIVARTRALRVGARLNTVTVRGDQPDSVPLNNVASALIRIVSSFRPPLQQRCGDLSVNRRVAQAGIPLRVRAVVENVFGAPLGRTLVRARGAGLSNAARTNARGVATLRLVPTRAGIVRFSVAARTLTAAGAKRCTAAVGVMRRAAIQPGVTG
jgi:uncharacterized repeat protein (TIGR01451 family)